jgi:hypothetical protein
VMQSGFKKPGLVPSYRKRNDASLYCHRGL